MQRHGCHVCAPQLARALDDDLPLFRLVIMCVGDVLVFLAHGVTLRRDAGLGRSRFLPRAQVQRLGGFAAAQRQRNLALLRGYIEAGHNLHGEFPVNAID